MKERPILFSGAMVRALLDGSKTQTRRPVSLRPGHLHKEGRFLHSGDAGLCLRQVTNGMADFFEQKGHWFINAGWRTLADLPCPYGIAGDRLRVKEAAWMWCERRPNGTTKTGRQKWLYVPLRNAPIFYTADHPNKPTVAVASPGTGHAWGWRLKIGRFLPAWASRLFLDVAGVRIEQLNDCSEADSIAEGISKTPAGFWSTYGQHQVDGTYNPLVSFRFLWESINGAGSWQANPWVWIVEFKRVSDANVAGNLPHHHPASSYSGKKLPEMEGVVQ